MWVFHQSSGVLEHNGTKITEGYSGSRSLGINLQENVPYYGPIPHGLYRIGMSFSTKSPTHVFSLDPIGHDAHGRTDFLIHGDYKDKQKRGTASEGCIILPLEVRKAVWASHDRILSVQF
jgi:hypothetical protein